MPYLGKTPSQATRKRYYKTASGSETSISGTMTVGGTLTFTDGEFVDVSVNGVALVAGTDYNTTTANTIGGLSALSANDQVEIIVYDTFSVFSGDVDSNMSVGGNLSVTGTTTLTGNADFNGDLDVDGTTNLDAVDIDGNVDIATTATLTCGAITSSISDHTNLTLTSTNADANAGPKIVLNRDSGSPADGDATGEIIFKADDDGGNSTEFAKIETSIIDASNTTEDGRLLMRTMTAGTATSRLDFTNTETVFNDSSIDVDFRVEGATNSHLLHVDAGDEAIRINATATAPGTGNTNVGIEFRETGLAFFSSASGYVAMNRNSDGVIFALNHDGNEAGQLGSKADSLYIGKLNTGLVFEGYFDDSIAPFSPSDSNIRDNAIDLGYGSSRFDDIYATNTSITTSDENEKQNIASLTSAEMTAAKAISALFKTYKWKDKVTAKGDAARTHTGVIAQEVQSAMSNAGLDATKYAFWCSDTWWEKSTEVAAIEATKENGMRAEPARTDIALYHTEKDAPEGATKRTRLGIRYPELLAFIGAATEQRLSDIETRLAALES